MHLIHDNELFAVWHVGSVAQFHATILYIVRKARQFRIFDHKWSNFVHTELNDSFNLAA